MLQILNIIVLKKDECNLNHDKLYLVQSCLSFERFYFSCPLVHEIHWVSLITQEIPKFWFFEIACDTQEEDINRSMIQLTWLSHQYSWRYDTSKLELKFFLTRDILQQLPKVFFFSLFKSDLIQQRWVRIKWSWVASGSIPLAFLKCQNKFHLSLQNFEQLSKIVEIWNQEAEDFIRNTWLSSL